MNLIKKTTQKLNKTKYSFKEKNAGIAGICPDCKSIVSFNSYHQIYECLSNECCFEANLKGERIWDNDMRDKHLNKIKTELNV